MLNVRLSAGGVFDGVFFVLSFFPLDALDEIWGVIESVSEEFLTNQTELNRCILQILKKGYSLKANNVSLWPKRDYPISNEIPSQVNQTLNRSVFFSFTNVPL